MTETEITQVSKIEPKTTAPTQVPEITSDETPAADKTETPEKKAAPVAPKLSKLIISDSAKLDSAKNDSVSSPQPKSSSPAPNAKSPTLAGPTLAEAAETQKKQDSIKKTG
jgi:hypothetical protein